MNNPFVEILEEIKILKDQIAAINNTTPATTPPEIINRQQLCERLNITEPTAIRWEKKGKIPSLRIGSNVRYNWPAVVEALQKG